MKKTKPSLIIISLVLLCAIPISFIGCDRPDVDTGLPPFDPPKNEGVSSVSIVSEPGEHIYSFNGAKANEIVDYFANLNYITDFTENPNEYVGMTWIVSIHYQDGSTETLYHFGNMFVRRDGGSWYKMTDEEASAFDVLLERLDAERRHSVPIEGVHTDKEGIYLTLESFSNTGIQVKWHNDTADQALRGESYDIEVYDTGTATWKSVMEGEHRFQSIAIALMPNMEYEKTYLTEGFDLSQTGKYRLKCEFYPSGGGICYTWVEWEFDIQE